jgi:hypothetical protein
MASAKKPPSALVARILAEGRPPFRVIDFPRYDHTGESIGKVHIRLLDISEERIALANGRDGCARLTERHPDYKSDLTDLEHNERMTEIMAVACRNPDNPELPFFEGGVEELRMFTSDEIGALAAVYARMKDENPRVAEMAAKDVDELCLVMDKELDSFPFSAWPHAVVSRLLESCMRRLASLLRGATPIDSGSSE